MKNLNTEYDDSMQRISRGQPLKNQLEVQETLREKALKKFPPGRVSFSGLDFQPTERKTRQPRGVILY